MNSRMCGTWLAGLVALAATSPGAEKVRINLDEPPAVPAPSTKTAPAAGAGKAPQAPAKPAPVPKPDKEAKIDGMEVPRGDRGYLGVKVEGGFRISFYGKDKKPIQADVNRIALRWPVRYQPNDERALLTAGDDRKVFSSEKIVKPPYQFKLYITLLKDAAPGEDPETESYVIDFSQQ